MAFLYPFLIVVHILICVSLIIVVLLQSAKGEGLAGAFGGGGLSGAVFGGRGAATFLSKATSILAVCFMLSSIGLTILSVGIRGGGAASGVIQNLKTGQSQPIPTTPSAVPGAPQQGTEQPGTTQPGTAPGAGSNLFNQQAPAQGQQPAAQPQQPATQPPAGAQPNAPATPTPGSGK